MEAQKLVHTIALISHTMSTDNTALGGWTIHEQKTINLQTNSDDSVSLEEYKLGTNVCMHITRVLHFVAAQKKNHFIISTLYKILG